MEIEIYSPRDYQVFQRQNKYEGDIILHGYVGENIKKLWVKITGNDLNNEFVETEWFDFEIEADGRFCQYMNMNAGGWYKVAFKDEKGDVVEIPHVGVGEILMGAGQSNSTNSGQFRIQTQTGMVATTDGVEWRIADDPMLGTHDMVSGAEACDGGSFYPALGDIIYEELHVPVGIASVGYGATQISDWQPYHSPVMWNNEKFCIEEVDYGENLFDYMINRMNQLGRRGFRCVLWHQGESDSSEKTPGYRYYDQLANLIMKSQKAADWYVPWFVAIVSYYQGEIMNHTIRDAQERICKDKIAFKGPDTDMLKAEYRDQTGVHFNVEGLKKHARMWADCIIPYIKQMTE